MEQVTFSECELGDVILALQHYAMHLESKGLHASACGCWEAAAKAALAYGWEAQALGFTNNASYCLRQCLAAAA